MLISQNSSNRTTFTVRYWFKCLSRMEWLITGCNKSSYRVYRVLGAGTIQARAGQ